MSDPAVLAVEHAIVAVPGEAEAPASQTEVIEAHGKVEIAVIEAQTEHDVAVIEAEAEGAATVIEAAEPTQEVQNDLRELREWHAQAGPRLAAVESELATQTSLLSSIQASLSELGERLNPTLEPSNGNETPPMQAVVESEREVAPEVPVVSDELPAAVPVPPRLRRYVIR